MGRKGTAHHRRRHRRRRASPHPARRHPDAARGGATTRLSTLPPGVLSGPFDPGVDPVAGTHWESQSMAHPGGGSAGGAASSHRSPLLPAGPWWPTLATTVRLPGAVDRRDRARLLGRPSGPPAPHGPALHRPARSSGPPALGELPTPSHRECMGVRRGAGGPPPSPRWSPCRGVMPTSSVDSAAPPCGRRQQPTTSVPVAHWVPLPQHHSTAVGLETPPRPGGTPELGPVRRGLPGEAGGRAVSRGAPGSPPAAAGRAGSGTVYELSEGRRHARSAGSPCVAPDCHQPAARPGPGCTVCAVGVSLTWAWVSPLASVAVNSSTDPLRPTWSARRARSAPCRGPWPGRGPGRRRAAGRRPTPWSRWPPRCWP